jgi:hypothetical protein
MGVVIANYYREGKQSVCVLTYCPTICLEELRIITKNGRNAVLQSKSSTRYFPNTKQECYFVVRVRTGYYRNIILICALD